MRPAHPGGAVSDADIGWHTQRAINAFTAKLRPWATGMQLPEAFATELMEILLKEGWRPVRQIATPEPRIADTAKATAVRGATAARGLLGLPQIGVDCRQRRCDTCAGDPCEHDCHTANRTRQDSA